MKRYIVATIKSWNIENAIKLSKKYEVYLITEKEDLTFERVREINPRYIFFPHWSWKIPKEILENYECVVFHMTDLPFGRGGSPLQNLIVRKIYRTKISAIKVVEELDAGPIYMKEDLCLHGGAEEIYMRASRIIFEKMIPHIIENEPIPKPQEGEVITFRRRKPEEGDISNLRSLDDVYDYIRMLDAEGYPPAFLEVGNLRLEFTRAVRKHGYVMADVKIYLKSDS
ncbi:MAG: methionyl-tRNA formyltransferase [Thermotogae bacterium]|nr:methionyl-tRNA formyltransferase [Thermotogota bacterium]